MDCEYLEEACDTVALRIDDIQGNVDFHWIDLLINEALRETTFSRDEFLEMFGNLYHCDPEQYAKNVMDDLNWEKENG